MKLTRIAIIGSGLIGIRHIESSTKTKDIVMVAVVDISETGRRIAESFNVPFFEDVNTMLETIKPEGVIVATPNELHLENAIPCIEQGIPVLVEKPFATNIQEANKVIQMAEQKKVPLLTGYFRRFNDVVQATKNQIQSGRIGDIVSIHSHFWLYKNDAYFDTAWRRKKEAGPININLCHDIDLLLYFIGDIEYVSACSSNTTRNLEVEDTAVILAKFKNAALGTINISDTIPSPWSWELTAGDNPTYPQTDQLYCMIGGTRGSIELPNNRIWYYTDERHWYKAINSEIFMKNIHDPLVAQIEHFAQVIRGEVEPIVSGLDGLKVMEVIEAIHMSIESGGRVYIDDAVHL